MALIQNEVFTTEKIPLFGTFLLLAKSIRFGQANVGKKGGDIFTVCQVLYFIFYKSSMSFLLLPLSDKETEIQGQLRLSELPENSRAGI